MRKEQFGNVTIYQGDCMDALSIVQPQSVDLIISSPPYNIGKEYENRKSIQEYLDWHFKILEKCTNALRAGGSIAWQVGNYIDKGSVYPIDCLIFNQFIQLGLTPRNRIIWTFGHGLHCSKRFSGRHEAILWFTKGDKYTFNLDAVRVPQKYPGKLHYKGPKKGMLSGHPMGKNPGDVWDISNVKHNHPEKTAHPCQFPEQLADRVIMSMCVDGGTVLDPFMGSGTAGVSCAKAGRAFVGIEMDSKYFEIARNRIKASQI
jgi:adenine-specific DNA-methyltransferase